MHKRVVLGTAGHIDHGKTCLVKALTGVDTDRLKEEKERGITIELGFTSLALPCGYDLGIVDMPGHERFIDHMVAGASGIDLVLLVVAADEGVMPQTREHLDICRLLGIKTGLIALTKVDLVDEDMEELAREDVRDLVKGTFLEGRPIVSFSSVTGQGKETLLSAIEQSALDAQGRDSQGYCRLPVDRVFTMKGFGTVVTGTLLSGKLHVGDPLEVLSSGQVAKVRGIQNHNRVVEESWAGCRTAVNLQAVDKSMVQRGDVLAEPGVYRPSFMVYTYFHYVIHNPKPLPDRFRVMFHWATTKVFARIILIGANSVAPGSGVWAQFRLEDPIFPVFGDRFIVRDFSTNRTLGGGIVLDPHSSKHRKKYDREVIPWLEKLNTENPEQRVHYFVWKKGFTGACLRELAAVSGLPLPICATVCRKLSSDGVLREFDQEEKCFVVESAVQDLTSSMLSTLKSYHEAHPYYTGLIREELRARLTETVSEKLYHFCLSTLVREGSVLIEKDKIRLSTHRAELNGEDVRLEKEVVTKLESAGLQPPTFKELSELLQCPQETLHTILEYLAERGAVLKVAEDLYFHPDNVETLKNRLVAFLREKGAIQTQEFKVLSDTTRKYTIPLLEYFDRLKITLRVGDQRILRDKASVERSLR